MTTMAIVSTAAAGVATWTIAEYLLHRFLGHDKRTYPNPFGVEHTRHHSDDYFAPTWKKALVALVTVPLVVVAASPLLGVDLAVVYGAAFAAMYVAYEAFHRRLHTHAGTGRWGRFLRRHHFHHHFGNPRMNHGVTSPLWDLIFGTFDVPRGRVRVPEKLCMRWLVEAPGGDVLPEHASHYEIVPRSSSSRA